MYRGRPHPPPQDPCSSLSAVFSALSLHRDSPPVVVVVLPHAAPEFRPSYFRTISGDPIRPIPGRIWHLLHRRQREWTPEPRPAPRRRPPTAAPQPRQRQRRPQRPRRRTTTPLPCAASEWPLPAEESWLPDQPASAAPEPSPAAVASGSAPPLPGAASPPSASSRRSFVILPEAPDTDFSEEEREALRPPLERPQAERTGWTDDEED
jgi:hypothetical protein